MAFGVNWRVIGWGFLGALLLLPLIAMQFTDEVKWGLFDFVFMGFLFGAVGLGVEMAVRKTRNLAHRAAAGLALLTGFFLIWVNAAAGIIGEDHPVSLVFLAVVLVALAGSALARFRARGMAVAMTVAAGAQALTPVEAWLIWPEMRGEITPRTLVLVGLFAVSWLGSAALFRKAATSAPAT